jgi:hypothetical protein
MTGCQGAPDCGEGSHWPLLLEERRPRLSARRMEGHADGSVFSSLDRQGIAVDTVATLFSPVSLLQTQMPALCYLWVASYPILHAKASGPGGPGELG